MDYITLTEYAKIHGVRSDTVRQKILAGRIPAQKVGSIWLIKRDEPWLDLRKKEHR